MTNKQTRASFWEKFHLNETVGSHLTGEHHTRKHKFMFGTLIMLLGVSVVKASMMIDHGIVHFMGDTVGFLIHGIGAIPVVDSITNKGGIHAN